MAAKKKTVSLVKSAIAHKTIEQSIANVASVTGHLNKAVDTTSKTAKQLATESKRLGKKRGSLLKKKKIASNKVKKEGGAAHKKALRDIEKELVGVKKSVAKTSSEKSAINEELTELKKLQKRASAYIKAITGIEKALNKPAKKRRKKMSAKSKAKAAATSQPQVAA